MAARYQHPPPISAPALPPPSPGQAGTSPLEIAEYALRIAFFLFVPFGVVLLAMLVPMGAAIVQMILALTAFFLGEMLVGAAEKRRWLKRVLRRQLAVSRFHRILILKAFKPVENACGKIPEEFRRQPKTYPLYSEKKRKRSQREC
jgi:hypothetical protein